MANYFRFPRRIFELGLTANELSVWTVLASHDFNPDHRFEVYPSMDAIRGLVPVHKEILIETLQFLHGIGLITIIKRKRPRGREMNAYILVDVENADDIHWGSIKARIPLERRAMKDRLKAKRAARPSVQPFNHNTDQQLNYDTVQPENRNTVQRIGFDIVQHEDRNINKLNSQNGTPKPEKEDGEMFYKLLAQEHGTEFADLVRKR